MGTGAYGAERLREGRRYGTSADRELRGIILAATKPALKKGTARLRSIKVGNSREDR